MNILFSIPLFVCGRSTWDIVRSLGVIFIARIRSQSIIHVGRKGVKLTLEFEFDEETYRQLTLEGV